MEPGVCYRLGVSETLDPPRLTWAHVPHGDTEKAPRLRVTSRHDTATVLDSMAGGRDYKPGFVHPGAGTGRLIAADSRSAMASLLQHEEMAGEVQCAFVDPPYGVSFGSNFQPFLHKRTVRDGNDSDMTREPEMVQTYRDTWEHGLHSYLSYLRDRLVLVRELLHFSGSIFVQIGEENVHHVRELLDQVFGASNFVSLISFKKTSAHTAALLPCVNDYLLFYARDRPRIKYHQLYVDRRERTEGGTFDWIELPDGSCRRLNARQKRGLDPLPEGRRFRAADLTSQTASKSTLFEVEFEGKRYRPSTTRGWSTNLSGMEQLKSEGRLHALKSVLCFKRFEDDFPYAPLTNAWDDTVIGTFTKKHYVVQTPELVAERCLLMTSDPGDLVLDPTCGSGTTALVAERWGRRWITMDVSRVPLAIATQRLLTASHPDFWPQDEARGPAGGFRYGKRGIVPRITLRSLATGELLADQTLLDRPELKTRRTRLTAPFTVEAPVAAGGSQLMAAQRSRMFALLQRTPVLGVRGGDDLVLEQLQPCDEGAALSAVAVLGGKAVGLLFGPPDAAMERGQLEAARNKGLALGHDRLFAIGFGLSAEAQLLLSDDGLPTTQVQTASDITMDDLLKTTRSTQLFSVCGLPEIEVQRSDDLYTVELHAIDVYDPVAGETRRQAAADVAAWQLDPDHDGEQFNAAQVYFPRNRAWDRLARAVGVDGDLLAATRSASFAAGVHGRIAVKVIDDRGNELLVTRKLQ